MTDNPTAEPTTASVPERKPLTPAAQRALAEAEARRQAAAATAKAQGLGAKVVVPPMPIEGAGIMSIIDDPQGAGFARLNVGTTPELLGAMSSGKEPRWSQIGAARRAQTGE